MAELVQTRRLTGTHWTAAYCLLTVESVSSKASYPGVPLLVLFERARIPLPLKISGHF